MTKDALARSTPVWAPSRAAIESANITAAMRALGADSLESLWALARADIAGFYHRLLAHIGLAWFTPYTTTLDLSRGPEFAAWFAGGRYNASYNCLDKHVLAGRGDAEALVWEGDPGQCRSFTFDELLAQVCRLSSGLRSLGVGKGDRVGIYMPLVPETAIALLAIGRIGAIAVPAFSGYAAPALIARLNDAGAKVLLTVRSTTRRGKPVDMLATALAAAREVSSIETLVVHSAVAASSEAASYSSPSIRVLDWTALVAAQTSFIEAERTAAGDPYLLLYTSGSTGKPKGAVHGHAGFPVKVQIDQYLCFDVKPHDRMLWFTDMGWMMGPFLVLGALGLGATVVLFDGTPDHPTPGRLWEVIASHKVTHLGIAPTAIRALMTHGDDHPHKHDLSSLRILGSSGEAWNPEPYKWFSHHVGGDRCPIINYSGGTEISGGILGCFPVRPLVPCAFHGPVPGMDADVVDERGNSVRGEVGELCIRQPWPGMTQSFWHDDERYLQTYWNRIPGVWVHGDWCSVDDEGYWYIQGRSDDTINVAGKRVGPAEYESALVAHPAVKEAAAVAVPDELKGESVVCLTVLRQDHAPTEALRADLMALCAQNLGKALAPKAVKFVADLPHTRNGKMMRRIARARYLKHASLGDLSALENPGSLEAIDAAR
ncbi:MAG TPA: AMP-binding protein [Candidatus Eremiobacteraceae bacterium]|nr:AMP-binding protein [Candidatus Eremiobacteraceae bacterium]